MGMKAPLSTRSQATYPRLRPARGFGDQRTPGRPLPQPVAGKMERFFGRDFSDVRVQEGAHVAALGTRAFTFGNEIHFAPGRLRPDTPEGQRLLGHELTHVVQQRTGRVPAATGRRLVNSDPRLEREARSEGARAAAGGPGRSQIIGHPVNQPSAGAALQGDDLDELPPELRVEILRRLDPTSAGRLARTSREQSAFVTGERERDLRLGMGAGVVPPGIADPRLQQHYEQHVERAYNVLRGGRGRLGEVPQDMAWTIPIARQIHAAHQAQEQGQHFPLAMPYFEGLHATFEQRRRDARHVKKRARQQRRFEEWREGGL